MSTVITNSITSLDGGAIETHISQDSEFVSEGGASVVANNTISFGTLKGYCTNFFQSNNSIQPDEGFATFNVSGVTDVGTGNIRYAHVNNYVATDDYIGLPNDGNYGKTYADLNATSTADQFAHTEDNSVSDTALACAFTGELA